MSTQQTEWDGRTTQVGLTRPQAPQKQSGDLNPALNNPSTGFAPVARVLLNSTPCPLSKVSQSGQYIMCSLSLLATLSSGGGRWGRQGKWNPLHSPSQQAPGLSLTPIWGGCATSGPASIAQDASWLTMAAVLQLYFPFWGLWPVDSGDHSAGRGSPRCV